MNKSIIGFIGGIVIGASITQIYCKVKYEKRMHEQIVAVKEEIKNTSGIFNNATINGGIIHSSEYNMKDESTSIEDNEDDMSNDDADYFDENCIPINKEAYQEIVDKHDYTTCFKDSVVEQDQEKSEGVKPVKSEKKKVVPPYVISPNDFDDHDPYDDHADYDVVSLVFYDDGVVAFDSTNKALTPIEITTLIGSDSLNHFGQYEDDSVFVRNDTLKCDYEILLSLNNYEDTIEQDD